MTPRAPPLGLTQRYLFAMGAVTVVVLAAAGGLLAIHAAGGISDRALRWGLFSAVALAGLGGIALIAGLANSFVRPLRAVVAALNDAAKGDYGTATTIGAAG
jgi:hypothetical protein